MCFESTNITFGSITEVGTRGDKFIIGLPSAFCHLFVDNASFIVNDLEVDFVAASCHPLHYGVVF